MNAMNANSNQDSERGGQMRGALPEDAAAGMQPRELDSAILAEQPQSGTHARGPVDGHEDELARAQVGAAVYAADGAEVAVVEIVGPGHLGIRAGQPGRTIDLPGAAVARVSPDGQRVDITLTEAQVEQFAGGESTGADHLAAQQNG